MLSTDCSVVEDNGNMNSLSLVRSFVAVVERGSFTKAAAHLGRSKGRVSAQIKELEGEVGSPSSRAPDAKSR